MTSKADLKQLHDTLNSLFIWSGVSDQTPSDTWIIEPDPGYHDGVTYDQLIQAMKTVDDMRVAASIGPGIIKII